MRALKLWILLRYFGLGLFNYLADVVPKQYRILRPFTRLFPKGDRNQGIVQLERAIRYARKQADTLAELRRTSHLLNSVLSYLPVIAGRLDGDGSAFFRGEAFTLY